MIINYSTHFAKLIYSLKNVPTKLDIPGFKKIENKLYFFIDKKIIQVDLQSLKSDIYLEYDSDELWMLNEHYHFYVNRTTERREYKFELYSKAKKEVIWASIDKLELTNLSNEYLIFSNLKRTAVTRYSLLEGDKIWELNFSENRISGDLFQFKNIIVISVANQDLLGVDIETGKELWRLTNCNLHYQTQSNTNYLVGLSSNSFGDNFYQVIDPVNGKKLIDKKFDNFFYETTPNLACITETHYYFISNVLGDGTGTKSKIISNLGCINLKTHELEWVEKIDNSTYQKLEVQNNKFYLLDGERTLHIYERVELS